MKNLVLLLFLATANLVIGQAPINHTICDNKSTTFWDDPNNDELPSENGQIGGQEDTRFLNAFNWVYGDDITNSNYDLYNMTTTFNNPYGQMTNIHPDPAPIAFYMYLYEKMLMSPENGWELLQFNLGRYPDNTPHSFTNLNYLPYIILYNKYSNIIRIFLTYGENQTPNESIDGVKIDLSFLIDPNNNLDNVSGLFRLGGGVDKTLDQTTSTSSLTAVAKNPGFENLWYSADFLVAYDPCTCKYPSILNVDFSFFSETDFELAGNALSANDVDMTTVQDLIANNFVGNFEWANNTADNGLIIYDNLIKSIDDYLARLAEYEQDLAQYQEESKRLKRNKVILTVLKTVLLGANPTSFVAGGISLAALASNNVSVASDVQSYAADLIKNDTLYYVDINKKAKEILTNGYDVFITKGFNQEPKPEKPEQPSVSYTQMQFQGKLFNDLDIGGTDFVTPGAFDNSKTDVNNYLWVQTAQTNSPFKFPIYNDVLGTFALLEKPKVKISRKILDHDINFHEITIPLYTGFQTYGQYIYNSTPFNVVFSKWKMNYQFQIAEELKYALNTNLDIKDYEVKIGFVIETKKALASAFAPELDNVVIVQNNNLETIPYWKKNQQVYFDPNLTFGMDALNAGMNSPYLWGGMNFGTLETFRNDMLTNNTVFDIASTLNPQGQSLINIGPNYDSLIWETEVVTKDYFNDAVYSLGLQTELLENWSSGTTAPQQFDPVEFGFDDQFVVKLKILVDIEYESINELGKNNTSTHIFTYAVNSSDITFTDDTELLSNIASNPMSVLTEIEDIAFYGDTHFAGQAVTGCHLVNGVYTCQAWDVLNIVGDITTAPGYSVNFYAGNEIIELPESSLTPSQDGNIVLQIDNQFTPNPIPHVTKAYVTEFCSGSNPNAPSYQANRPTKNWTNTQSQDVQNSDEESIADPEILLKVFPVPATNMINLSFSGSISNVNIQIYDLSGRLVPSNKIMRETESLYSVDVSGINSGSYNLFVRTDKATFSKRIIIF